MGKEFEKNHYFPKYNLQYWKIANSTLYDKKTKKDRNFNPANNFHLHKFYYFDGTPALEKRISKIESFMARLLKKISSAVDKSSVELSEYEINFIQLFLFLQASRHLNTTEVIKSDESGLYQSNNFFWGTHNIKTQEAMQREMHSLVNALESLIKKKKTKDLSIWLGLHVSGTHLVIAKNNENQICQSDVCCIIENDMDSNHMYTYFPQTPNLAFFLVKTKYFYRNWHRLHYLARINDTVISPILQQSETALVCQYEKAGFSEKNASSTFSMAIMDNFELLKRKRIRLKFFELSQNSVNQYNKILFDDGTIFIHNQTTDYITFLETLSADYRKITVCEPDVTTAHVALDNKSFRPLLRVQACKTINSEDQTAWEEQQRNKFVCEALKGKTWDEMINENELECHTFLTLPCDIFHPLREKIEQKAPLELALLQAVQQSVVTQEPEELLEQNNNLGDEIKTDTKTESANHKQPASSPKKKISPCF